MHPMTLRLSENPLNAACSVCGEPTLFRPGPRLFADDAPVCRECGRRVNPRMTALLELAGMADKVGRSCRHLLTPPMEMLLDLARAAENYSQAPPASRRSRAG